MQAQVFGVLGSDFNIRSMVYSTGGLGLGVWGSRVSGSDSSLLITYGISSGSFLGVLGRVLRRLRVND